MLIIISYDEINRQVQNHIAEISYPEHERLNLLPLADEAPEVSNMARRLAALLLLEPALNENYRSITAAAYAWPAGPTA